MEFRQVNFYVFLIELFTGKHYYVFHSHNLLPGYPKLLTELGLPESVEKIDAALIWGHNNRTYFYSGKLIILTQPDGRIGLHDENN